MLTDKDIVEKLMLLQVKTSGLPIHGIAQLWLVFIGSISSNQMGGNIH
jgi:hypothetical protein